MPVTPTTFALIGTSQGSPLSSIANNATSTSSVTDFCGSAAAGEGMLFVQFTGAGTTGTFDIYLDPEPDGSGGFSAPAVTISIPPISGAQKLGYGPYPLARYGQLRATNNGTGGNLTNIYIELQVNRFS